MPVRITQNTRWRRRIQAIPTKTNVEEKPHFLNYCSHPFEKCDDVELFKICRFRRLDISAITDSIRDDAELANRRGVLTPPLQVMVSSILCKR